MPSRGKFVSGALAVGVAACAATAAWWWLDVDRSAFYTDGSELRAGLAGHAPRDVLWQSPEAVLTVDGDRISALDAFVSPDESAMVLTRRTSRGDTDLYHSTRSDAGWSTPRPIPGINSLDNELSPALSPDGSQLYFATDRPGGRGGLDIWSSKHTESGWSPPAHAEWNSAHDDTDPHPAVDQVDGSHVVLFTSGRPVAESEDPPPGFSLFAVREGDAPFRLRRAPVGHTLSDPALTPAADFLYWVSSPIDGDGAPELLRQRPRLDPQRYASSEQPIDEPEPMDDSIAALSKISSPSLSLEGFALNLLAGPEENPNLQRAVAREVYLTRTSARGDLIRVIPWILLALAAVMLLSLLRRGVTSVRWQTALGTLGLMARCVLASLVLHAALMALLTVLHVPEEEGEPSASSTGRVALSASSVRSALAEQLRTLDRSESPAQARQALSRTSIDVAMPTRPEPAQLSPMLSDAQPSLARRSMPINEAAPSSASEAAALAMPVTPIGVVTPSAQDFRLPSSSRPAAVSAPEPAMPSFSRSATAFVADTIPTGSFDATAALSPTFEPSAAASGIAMERFTTLVEADPINAAAISGGVELLTAAAPDLNIDSPEIGLPAATATPVARADADEASAGIAHMERSSADAATRQSIAASASLRFDAAPLAMSDAPTVATSEFAVAEADAALTTIPLPELALTPPPAAPALGGLSLPEVVDLSFDLVGVVVDDDTSEPIAGATVRLDLAAEDDAVATTKQDGSFGLSFEQMPDNAAVTATMPGYTPGAVNISATQIDTGERVTIRLSPDDPFLIALEQSPEVHHLGDDAFTGRINSQFQRESEGLSLSFNFTLTEDHARLPVRGVEFRVLAKGTQLNNPVTVNGKRVGVFDDSPSDGGFGEQRFLIPAETLRLGENTVKLRSVDSPGTDHDDFEFVNPRIVFIPSTGGPV